MCINHSKRKCYTLILINLFERMNCASDKEREKEKGNSKSEHLKDFIVFYNNIKQFDCSVLKIEKKNKQPRKYD